MTRSPETQAELAAIADHMGARRGAILAAWAAAVHADPGLTTASSLPRSHFIDHIPFALDAYERKLRASTPWESAAAKADQSEYAAEHGLQRWQQGYNLREVTREWGHLHLSLVDELEEYAATGESAGPAALASARRALIRLCNDGVSESTAQYFQMRQVEAVGHVRDLESALADVRELERQRAELWRQAAHDLRGNLGVVANVTAGLTLKGLPEPKRDNFVRLLQKSVTSLNSMLEDVMGLARFQAGHEQRTVEGFDAAAVLRELIDNLQPLAGDRGLYLTSDGPTTLAVEGDAVKVRRIAQNLLLNALKYTAKGGVTVTWGDGRDNDPDRWVLTVRDTGPGFHAGPGAPLAAALEAATQEARNVDESAADGGTWEGLADPDPPDEDPRPIHQEPGEGIGLSIVKRLCELLDAGLELESKPGEGTTFRVLVPRHYAESGPTR